MLVTSPVIKRRRDWFMVIRTLMRYGVSMSDIARACDVNPSAVKGWADGSDPKEADARIVLGLMAKYAPNEYIEHQREFNIRVTLEELGGLNDVAARYGVPMAILEKAIKRAARQQRAFPASPLEQLSLALEQEPRWPAKAGD